MMLTNAQKSVLATDIRANTNPTIVAALAIRNDRVITDFYNSVATPDFWLWKSDLKLQDIYGLTSPAPVNGTWNWTFYSGMNSGEQGSWLEMAGPTRSLNLTLSNIRNGITTVFKGPQGGDAQANHILALGRYQALLVEKLFATGTGSVASPGLAVFQGPVEQLDLSDALNRF